MKIMKKLKKFYTQTVVILVVGCRQKENTITTMVI